MTASERPDALALDIEQLLAICSSERWARLMASSGPYDTPEALLRAADLAFDQLQPAEWHQGIAGHARIAEIPSDDEREAREQSGINDANTETLAALHAGNAAYEARFGYMFLIRASGRSATEMLAFLRQRLHNPPEAEFRIATDQLREITRLRLSDITSQ